MPSLWHAALTVLARTPRGPRRPLRATPTANGAPPPQGTGPFTGRINTRGSYYWHRRTAQRRQINPFQRTDPQPGARGELPVRHDRAQRRRREPAGPAAREAGRDLRLGSACCPPPCPSWTSPASSRARPRARAWATSSSPTSARPRRSRRSSACSMTPTSSTSTARSTPLRHGDHQHRADPGRPPDHREGRPADRKRSQDQEARSRRAGRRQGGPGGAGTRRHHLLLDQERQAGDGAPQGARPAHGQALHLRLQLRRRGNPWQPGEAGRAARHGGPGRLHLPRRQARVRPRRAGRGRSPRNAGR